MVAPIENRSQLAGVVRARRPSPDVRRWDVLDVEVTEVRPVEGVADLMSGRVGDVVEIAVDRDALPAEDVVGRSFEAQVRMSAPGRVIVAPSPESAEARVTLGPAGPGAREPHT